MKKIRYIAGLMACLLLLSVFIPMSAYADETDYKELFVQRKEYLQEFGRPPGDDFMATSAPFIPEVGLTVLLYTDVAKTFTFEKIVEDGFEDPYLSSGETWFCSYGDYHLESPEIDKAIKAQLNKYGDVVRKENSSHLRACIQYFGISKDELIAANKRMQEDPDAIRSLLTCLEDYEYEYARYDNGMFCSSGPIPDYAIEALYIEDDVVANNLLCPEWSVYLGDSINRVVTAWEIRVGYLIQIDELAACDLTPEWVGDFIERNIQNNYFPQLAAAREAQLQAKQTGDGALTSVLVLAIAVPTLATLVVVRKKRKI